MEIKREKTQVDEIFEGMARYSKEHMGIKNGEDFARVAQVLVESRHFRNSTLAAVAIGALNMLALPKDLEDTKAAADYLEANNPFREVLADMFYAGYRFGRRSAEVEQLENLATKET